MTTARRHRGGNADDETAQALIRIVSMGSMCLYLVPQILLGYAPPETYLIVYLVPIHLVLSAGMYWWISHHPGENRLRRTFTTSLDFAGITYAMAIGGAPFVPLYVIVLRIIVGNGLRHGQTDLKITTGLALASMAVTTFFSAYWRQNPFLVVTLFIITLLVPNYIYILLNRLRGAYQREQEANLAKSRFLGQASHDLRQPIHAISLFTACLRDANLGAKELQMVDNIDRSLQSVSRLFKSLLDVSTLDSGKVQPRIEPVAIDDIIEDVLRQNSEAAQRTGTELRSRACRVIVETDRALFTTMLQNIVNNAIKYAPGRPILIACRRRKGGLAVQVYDRGPGIAPEHQTKVFDEFYRVRQRGDKDIDGVGLGLPIVRRLCELLDLELRLRSVPLHGTCVTFGPLPIVGRPAEASRKPALDPAASVNGLRVLLVEDDEAVLAATADLLRRWGCQVQPEPTIPKTITATDLLITDFELGNGVTGTECIAAVQEALGRDVPVVVISGHDAGRVQEDLGRTDVPILSKPVRPAELRSVILAASVKLCGSRVAV